MIAFVRLFVITKNTTSLLTVKCSAQKALGITRGALNNLQNYQIHKRHKKQNYNIPRKDNVLYKWPINKVTIKIFKMYILLKKTKRKTKNKF